MGMDHEHDLMETGLGAVADGGPIWEPEAVITAPADLKAALPPMTQQQLAGLARELAMDIKTLDNILNTYNLTNDQYEFLAANNEFFKQALKTLTIEWNSAVSTPERIKLEAAAALEDAMPRLSARMVNQAEGLPGVTEIAKLFAKIAGVGERDQQGQGPPGERFTITINLGGDEKLVVGTKEIAPSSPDAPRHLTLRADPERPGEHSAEEHVAARPRTQT